MYFARHISSQMQLLEAGEVHLWLIPVRYGVAELSQPAAWLDALELSAFNELLFERDRLLYAQAHAWLRRIVAEYLRCSPASLRFVRNEAGKPSLQVPATVPALRFNLSHTHSGVLIGLSTQGEVGVDLEKVRPLKDLDLMVRNVLHPSEHHQLEHQAGAAERLDAFFRFWTAKEAYVKAVGTGLSHGLRKLAVVLQGQTTCFIEDLSPGHPRKPPMRGCSAVLASQEMGEHYALAAVLIGSPARFVLHCMPRDTELSASLRPTVMRTGAGLQ